MTKLVILLLSGVFFAGCFGPFADQDSVNETDRVMESESFFIEEAEFDETLSPDDLSGAEISASAVQLVASDFSFGVKEIRVNVGDELTVMVTNEQGVHDLVINELNVDSGLIPVGDTVSISIPTDQPGEYEYYCSVGSHRDMGMRGTLIIE